MNPKIKAAIDEAGLIQAEVAAVLGVSEATASRLFAGVRDFTDKELTALLAELQRRLGRTKGLTPNDVLGADLRRSA